MTIDYTCPECGGLIDNATWYCVDCNFDADDMREEAEEEERRDHKRGLYGED